MVTREDIVAEIQKVPEEHLDDLYQIIKKYERKNAGQEDENQSVMAKLRQIRISASPDFSIKTNL
jgi:hypothetical protein